MRFFAIMAIVVISGCAQDRPNVRRSNPPTLYATTNYAHVVSTSGGRTIYVSGLVPLGKDGKLVGADASQIAKFREVRSEYFKDPPASTAVEVRALVRPG